MTISYAKSKVSRIVSSNKTENASNARTEPSLKKESASNATSPAKNATLKTDLSVLYASKTLFSQQKNSVHLELLKNQ